MENAIQIADLRVLACQETSIFVLYRFTIPNHTRNIHCLQRSTRKQRYGNGLVEGKSTGNHGLDSYTGFL